MAVTAASSLLMKRMSSKKKPPALEKAVSFHEDITQTSTTKALLLTVAVPRIYRVYLPPTIEEEEEEEEPAVEEEEEKEKEEIPPEEKGTEDDTEKAKGAVTTQPPRGVTRETIPNSSISKEGDANPQRVRSNTVDTTKSVDTALSDKKKELVVVVEDIVVDPKLKKKNDNKIKNKIISDNNNSIDDAKKKEEQPRKRRLTAADKNESFLTETTATATTMASPNKEEQKDAKEEHVEEEEEEHVMVGYVENDGSTKKTKELVEHVVTEEEMAAVVKIDPKAPEKEQQQKQPKEGEKSSNTTEVDTIIPSKKEEMQNKQILADKTTSTRPPEEEIVFQDNDLASVAGTSIAGTSVPGFVSDVLNFFGVVKNDQPVYMSREEAMMAMHRHHSSLKRMYSSTGNMENSDDENGNENDRADDEMEYPKWNTEIRVEALLRIAFRNMYDEGHFFNAPIYSDIQSRLKEDEAAENDWIQVVAMVKQESTGVIFERLERIGVGSTVGTISIFKAELCRTADFIPKQPQAPKNDDESTSATTAATKESKNDDKEPTTTSDAAAEKAAAIEAARSEWKNAASRLRVEQVKEQIHEQAQMSLDFLALLSIASILAGIGLITDNTVVIVASMLVSPIMGPVMGMTFGSRVLDWSLASGGAMVEFLALLISVLIGFIIGLSTSTLPVAEDWPTLEMSGRGDQTGLITGIAIAIPSGMGVALSILGNNTSSLVGVAISASLLPPAVNAGICWAHAILVRAKVVENTSGEDFARIAGISFALTIVNIVCIWVFGMLMFKIKEVAPSKTKSAFWAKDIKTARAVQRGKKDVDLDVIKTGIEDALEKERKNTSAQPGKEGIYWAKPPRYWNRRGQRNGSGNFTFNLQENPIDEIAPIPDFVGGPTPLTDDIRYVGLEDMGALLGFLDDSDDEEQPPPKRSWFQTKP